MNKKGLNLSGVRPMVVRIFIVVFFILLFSQPLFALEQITNGTFDTNSNGWVSTNPDPTSGRAITTYWGYIGTVGNPAGSFYANKIYEK